MVTIVICVIAPKRVVTVAISDNKTGEVFTSEYG